MDRTPAADKVVIYIDKTDTKHNGGTRNRPARPVASAYQVARASGDWRRAHAAQAALRDRAQANQARRARTAAALAAAYADEPDRQLRNRAARRCAVGCFCSTAAVLLVGLPPAFLYRNEPAQVVLAAFGVLGPFMTLVGCSGEVDPRESLERRLHDLDQRGKRIDRQLVRATEDLSLREAALTQNMKSIMVARLTEHTSLLKDMASLVADYVGTNEYLPQVQG